MKLIFAKRMKSEVVSIIVLLVFVSQASAVLRPVGPCATACTWPLWSPPAQSHPARFLSAITCCRKASQARSHCHYEKALDRA